MNAQATGARRQESRALAPLTLRALIANDCALLALLGERLEAGGERHEADPAEREKISERLGDAIRRCMVRRARLPAEPAAGERREATGERMEDFSSAAARACALRATHPVTIGDNPAPAAGETALPAEELLLP